MSIKQQHRKLRQLPVTIQELQCEQEDLQEHRFIAEEQCKMPFLLIADIGYTATDNQVVSVVDYKSIEHDITTWLARYGRQISSEDKQLIVQRIKSKKFNEILYLDIDCDEVALLVYDMVDSPSHDKASL